MPPPEAEQIALLRQQLQSAERKLQWAEERIRVLEECLRLQRIKKYGPGSEKLSDAQLALLELEPGVSRAEVQAESQREPLPAAPRPPRGPHPGRQELPADLPRVEQVLTCAPEQCTCPACGQPTVVIGHDVSEQLDVEPARYFVRVTKREKRACPCCGEGGVATAPLPARIIEKGLVSDRVVIDTVVAKYSDHLPLYRQSAILKRETGLELSRASLDGWVMRVGELLTPVAEVMGRELVAGTYIQADETPVDVQMHDGRGQNHPAWLWQYSRPGGSGVFDFRLGRSRDGPKQFLGQFKGILQTDGYAAYEQVGGPKIVHAGCWAHARRKFLEAVKLNPGDAVAARIVARIDELFAIDAEARARNLDLAARHALRQQRAQPLLDPLHQEIEVARTQALPAGAYTLNLSLTGKATFGFVSKYGPGATVPGGDTQFQFHAAGMELQSTAYEWLVVAGARAQYKGSGTVNGTGTYQFLLTAIDGDLPGGDGIDRFRIKIWGAGGIVYDNQMGADDQSDPTTGLGGGSIVIHRQ